jgi:hypothetical protein
MHSGRDSVADCRNLYIDSIGIRKVRENIEIDRTEVYKEKRWTGKGFGQVKEQEYVCCSMRS